ncbi:MAG: hypothetical protein KF734_12115 [Saprospiraceae bacterium]|nr:hypothetical protein [Saprospiraceae bacterium]
MNHDEILFDKIEAYLRGRLSPAEASAFEAEIAADPALAALVKTHRMEREGLEWLVERDLLAKMSSWERDTMRGGIPSKQPVARARRRTMWWAVSIAATLTAAFFGWWLLQPQADIGGPTPIVSTPSTKPPAATAPPKSPKPSPKPPASTPPTKEKEDERVAELPQPKPSVPSTPPPTQPTAPTPYTPPPNYPALAATFYRQADFIQESSTPTNGDAPGYGQALDNFKSGKYAEAEKWLKPKSQQGADALKNKELLAHSLYQRGQYAEALTYFRQLSGASDKAIAERSEWAMALTLLHLMPAQKALFDRTLDRIAAQPNHAFQAKAKALKVKVGQ